MRPDPRLMGLALLLSLGVHAPPARADQVEARICAGQTATAAKNERWRIDQMQAWDIEAGSSRYLLLNLQSDIEYRLVVCGDIRAAAVSVVVYDAQGQLVSEVNSDTREADVLISADRTGEYFAGVRLDQVALGVAATGDEEGRKRKRRKKDEALQLPAASVSVALLYR